MKALTRHKNSIMHDFFQRLAVVILIIAMFSMTAHAKDSEIIVSYSPEEFTKDASVTFNFIVHNGDSVIGYIDLYIDDVKVGTTETHKEKIDGVVSGVGSLTVKAPKSSSETNKLKVVFYNSGSLSPLVAIIEINPPEPPKPPKPPEPSTIPEFPSHAVPVIAMLGIFLILGSRKND